MDVRQFISSGNLELYLAGVLSQHEADEVKQIAEADPEIARQIQAIEHVIENYAKLYRQQPASDLKSQILSLLESAGIQNAPVITPAKKPEVIAPSVRKIQKISAPGSGFKYIAILAILGLLVCTILFINKWRESEDRVDFLVTQNYHLADNYKLLNEKYLELSSEMSLLRSPDIRQVKLKGSPAVPDAVAFVYWNERNGETYLELKNIPPIPEDNVFQLWALHGGKPMDLGVLNVSDTLTNTLQRLKNIERTDAFIITLEKKGGNTFPALDQIYLSGKL